MTVETAELENHLAKYLGQIRATGESITVLSDKEPVALLVPLARNEARAENLIDRLFARPMVLQDFIPLPRAALYERK